MALEAPHSSLRVAGRLAIGFALDLVKLGGFGRDVVDGLLMAAISAANVAQITRSPELQRAYATLDQPPPDDLRRPVSISAVANSLRIPFETARRRIGALAELGVVRTVPGKGVIIPQAPLNSPFYRMGAAAHYALVRNLYFRVRALGLLDDLVRPNAPPFDPDHPPVRLVVRLSSDFILRMAEPLALHLGDLVSGLILMDVFAANTQHLPDSEGGSDDQDWSALGFVPDRLRRPVRAATLAERLGIPPETVRRHLARLHKEGRLERIGDGFIVPAAVLARAPVVQYLVDNQSHLHRLYAGLADFGVLAEWEREMIALRGAA
jgi:DNA-binding Lrp family transcriptional regulator